MLNQQFNQKPAPTSGPRQQGQPVTNPRILAALAIKNTEAANQELSPPSPLAQALSKKKKNKY